MKTVIIDATSIVNTGGFTHLYNILDKYDKSFHTDIKKIIVFSSLKVLNKLPDNKLIYKKSHFLLNRGKFLRLIFQLFFLDYYLKKHEADTLLSLSGDYVGSFKPYVGMSQNMLLYEKEFWYRIKQPKEKLKLYINYLRQKKCFESASGLIFISKYAQEYISNSINIDSIPYQIINHGVSSNFFCENLINSKFKIDRNSEIKLLYISTIHVYKNQSNVINAICQLRKMGYNISLTLIGPIIYSPSGKEMLRLIDKKDKYQQFIKYISSVAHDKLPKIFKEHNAIVYASTCENMPNILIESMASGLPIACSIKEPMPEFLKNGGYYFNANSVNSISKAIVELINDNNYFSKVEKNLKEAKKYKWENSSKKTFSFISDF